MQNRRKFLKQVGIGTTSITIFKRIPYKKIVVPYKHLHVKETNFTLSATTPSVIGFIHADFPEKVERSINELRLKNHYKKRLSFRSTDKYKLSFAKDLIDYFFNEPSIYFYGRIVNSTTNLKKDDINLTHDIEYRVNYRKALEDLKELTKTNAFYLDFITNLPRKNSFQEHIIKEEVPYVNFKTSKTQLVNYLNSNGEKLDLKIEPHNHNNLSQIADFFTGNIYGDMIGVENKTKIYLLAYLKKKLGVKKISQLYNSLENKKFIISSIHK
ncbi:MAG: hypothetical protein JWR50_3242 [Mucilaginibacter sp.]|nr:hypothetical protein [Mucilaginibacter sp.]